VAQELKYPIAIGLGHDDMVFVPVAPQTGENRLQLVAAAEDADPPREINWDSGADEARFPFASVKGGILLKSSS
jgi:hypothetical protein